MSKLIFLCYVIMGTVQPDGDVDGRQTYTLCINDTSIEYVYKGEILQWIESGEFVYNEDLKD